LALYDDIITAQAVSPNSVVSIITLSALVDSGWYQVDLNASEPFLFGKNKGCSFWNNKCYGGNYNGNMCQFSFKKTSDVSGKFVAECSTDGFSNDCKALSDIADMNCAFERSPFEVAVTGISQQYRYNDVAGEVFGLQSKCLINTFTNAESQVEF
jgi:hypothetical protein